MIKENVLQVKARIASLCAKLNQDPGSITIVVVSKGRRQEEIKEVVATGITDIGENRVQEALIKYYEITKQRDNEITSQRIKWHMVGHLQTNKVKEAVKIFDLIHSVDSLKLAAEIDRQAAKMNKIQDILMQVNTSSEVTKSGLKPDGVVEVIKEITKFKNINIKGLMTIAPLVDNPEKTRPYFRILRELRDEINELNELNELNVLSMGMTDDFQVAIEEGANMVRLGRVIFG